MAQKLRKHGKKLEKTSVGCHIDYTILLSMLKVKNLCILQCKQISLFGFSDGCLDVSRPGSFALSPFATCH